MTVKKTTKPAIKKTNTVAEEGSTDITKLLLDKIIELEKKVNENSNTSNGLAKEVYEDKVKTASKRSPLMPGKIVEITPVNRGSTNTIKDSDQATMLDGVSKSIMVPVSSKLKRLIDPLETWEKEYLEEVLGLNLNIHSRDADGSHDSFYTTSDARVIFKKKSRAITSAARKFDLGDPLELLLFKICLSSPRVASNWRDRNDRRYEFVVKDTNAELNEELTHTNKEDVVIEYLFEIKHNKKALYDLFRLYGSNKKKVSLEHSTEFIYNELRKVSKTMAGIRQLYKIISLNDVDPSKLEKMILIEDAVLTGFLIRRGNEFKLPGGDVIGFGVDEVITYLENPENSTTKLRLITTINNYYKDKK